MKRTMVRLLVIVDNKTVYTEEVLPENCNAAKARLEKAYPNAKIKHQTILPGDY